jgi:23S rRNA (cytidine1920-2'-O)/16S rRNA (cytidine1409-2'-O)-methyltransferase
MRLDLYLVETGLASSRERAKTLIKSGSVTIDGVVCTKPAEEVGENPQDSEIAVTEPLKYVSRGGYKLEFALIAFDINVKDFICLDIGASTGGFTDCLLQNGASSVIAVDVGTNQLHESLKNDERVKSLEQSDFRKFDNAHFADIKLDLIVCDVSFISITKVIPAITGIMNEKTRALLLIKPQFEIKGRHKNGIIRDKAKRKQAVETVVSFAEAAGLKVLGVKECPFTGKDGNIEFFMLCEKCEKAIL